MIKIIWPLIILLMLVSSGCNNPSGDSVVQADHTPLLKAPGAFKFSQIVAANGNINLQWQPSDRVSEYKVFIGTSSTDITTPVTTCTFTTRSCAITGLDPATLYYLDVKSSNAAGTKSITTVGTALSVGAFDITSSSVADGQMNLTWSASDRATSYNVVYGTSSGSYSAVKTNVTSPYSLTGLNNGVTYYARVVAANNNNGYVLSDSEKNAKPFGVPSSPAGLNISALTGQMDLDWTDVPGATSYKIYRGAASGALTELATGVASSRYSDTTITDGNVYFYAVKAFNGYDSALSTEASAKSISAFNISSVTVGPAAMQLTVSWPTTVGASAYDIKYGTNQLSLNLTATNVNSPFILSGLTGGATYYFKVVAKNSIGLGTSLESMNQLAATPIAAVVAPTGLTASASPSQIILNWTSVSGAASYEVLRGTSAGSYTSLQAGVVGSSYTDSTAANGTPYYYVVRSFNGLSSGNSLEVAAKPIESFTISSITPVSSTSLQITRAPALGAETFDILYGTTSGTYTGTVTSVSSPYVLMGLSPSTNYYVVVRAKNTIGLGTSILSSQSSAQTKTAAPSGLVATTSPGQVSLDWTNVAGATTYSVYRGIVSGSYSLLASGLTASSYVDSIPTPGNTYFYVVSASNSSESAYSSVVSAKPISTFAVTSTSAPSTTSISITWPEVTGADSYDVKYGTATGVYTTTLTNKISPLTISGLTSGATYYAIVVAKNAVGLAGSSQNSNQVIQGTPMGPPTGLAAAFVGNDISLTWNSVVGVTSYKIYRGITPGAYTLLAANNVTNSFVDTTVVDGTVYYYVVKSYNGADSADSIYVSAKSIADFSITSVTGLSPNSLQVTFPETSGGELYDVRYGTVSGTYSTTASAVASPYTISGLSANTNYYIVVRARNIVGTGASRTTLESTIKTTVAAPASLVATALSSRVNLTWGAVSGAASYKVYRGTSPGSYTELATGVASANYSDLTVLNDGTTYYYRVKAFNGSDSAASSEVLAQPIASFSIASTTSLSATSIQVTWPTTIGATSYNVYYGTTSGTYTGSALAKNSPYTISGLSTNTNYFIVVKALNTVGTGAIISTSEVSQKTATATPTSLVAVASPGQVGLNWAATPGASSYKVFRRISSGSYTEIANTVSTAAYMDTGLTDGLTYSYAVKATNGSDSAYSDEVSVTPIGTFTLTSAVATSSTSANITWTAATGATSYDIRYGTSSGVYLTTVTGVTSSYALSGLTAGTNYYFSIRATNTLGSTTNLNSNELNLTTATSAPTSLVASAVTGQINLSWAAKAGANSYNIYRRTVAGSHTLISSGVLGTTYSDTTITDGTQYYYVVRAFNGTESPNSNEPTANSIAAFSIASTTPLSTNSMSVAWATTLGASTYDVRYGTTSGTYTTLSSVASPYTLTGLSAGVRYYIVVRANNAIGSGSSAQTPEVSQVTALAAPTGLASSSTPGNISLTWNSVAGAASYKIYRAEASGPYTALASGVLTNSYSDSTVSNGITYLYVVKAFNGADSANSNVTTSLPISSFAITSATALSFNTIELTWPAAHGASTYNVKYGTTSGTYTTTLTAQTSPKIISGLSAGSTYYFVVTANNDVGTGSSFSSAEVGATTAFGAPTGLVASAVPGQVNLSWTSVSGALSYKVFRGTSLGSYTEIASGVGTNSYADTGISNGIDYYYAVKAFSGVDSPYSNPISVNPISTFTFSSATAASSSSINLVWTGATGAGTYDVRYGTSTGSYSSTVTSVNSPYTLSGLSAGSTYYISIRAKNAVGAGTSVDSSELSAKTSPNAPGSLAATTTASQIALTWSASASATTYNVYRGTVSGTHTQIASAVASTSYNDTSAVNGTTYFYTVRANNGSESTNSNEVSAQSITAFSIASVTATSPTSLTVTWPATAGAATYDVRYGTATGSYTTTVSGVASPYIINGLTSAATYYVVVRANNAIGTGSSAQTSEVSKITPLSAPLGLYATPTSSSIALTWTAVSGASSYKVYRGTTLGSYTVLNSSVVTNSYTDATAVNGTTYYYVVKAFNGSDSADSLVVSGQPIAYFSIATISSSSPTTIDLSWPTPVGATAYDVLYGTVSGTYTTTLSNKTAPFTITDLLPNTTYYIAIRAKNTVGTGCYKNSPQIIQKTATAAPTGLIASASAGQVGLNWTAVSGATTYKVYRGTTSGSLTLLSSSVATNAYLDTPVTNGTTYFYAVSASNGSDSANSSEVSVQPISSFSLTAATSASATTINLSWGSATGAATYDVRYGTASGVYLGTVSAVTSPYTLTGLTSGTTYFISIQAKNAIGLGTILNSNELNAKTAVGAPTGLAAVSTPSNVSLSWSAVSGATNYNIYRGTTSGSYSQIASAVSATSYVDSPVTNGTTYYYMVRTFNGIESADSSEVSTQPIANFALTAATAASSSTIALTWANATGGATYDVRYGTSSGNYTSTLTNQTSPVTITGLATATQYYISIRANNSIGSGTNLLSNELASTTATAAPTSLAAAATTGQVNLTWGAALGAASYRIYRGTTSGIYTMIQSGILVTNFTDSTIVNGTTYFYVVRAFNGSESANSNEATASSISNFAITSVTAASTSSLQVTWPAVTGATVYDVRYSTSAYYASSGSYGTTIANVVSPYTISGLLAGTTYYVVVIARNTIGSGASVTSPQLSQITPVAAPVGLVATGGNTQVNLSWTAAAGASSYKILRGTASGVYTEIASAVTGTTYSDTTVVNGTTYYYALRSFNGSDSASSLEVFKQPIAAPVISSISGNTNTSVLVTWSAATGATLYDVRYGTTSGTYTTTLTGATSPYSITGLSAGVTYYVQVLAKNNIGGGTTVNSAESSGAPNSPPEISIVADQTMVSDSSLDVDFTLNDNNNLLSCAGSLSASSSNTALLLNSGIVFSGSVPNCTATITPKLGQMGSAIITITATDGITPMSESFNLTVSGCSVASISWVTQPPANTAAGTAFATAPKVSLHKADGTLCTTNFSPVTLDLGNDASIQQDAFISGTATVVPVAGYATFTGVSIQRAGSGHTLNATQGAATTAVDSSTFNITALAASKIIFAQQPISTGAAATMLPAPIVRIADTYGNYVTGANVGITLALRNSPAGTSATGATGLTATTASGVATFATFKVSTPGTYYVTATPASTYPAITSNPFSILTLIPQNTISVIDLIQGPVSNPTTTTTYYGRAGAIFGTNNVNGTVTWGWKIVATNTGSAQSTVRLRVSTSTQATILVPGNTTTPTLFTGTFSTQPGTSSTYRLSIKSGSTGATTTVHSLKITATQTNATKAMVYIPLTSLSSTAASVLTTTTTNTSSMASPNNLYFPAYTFNSSKFNRMDSASLIFSGVGTNSCVTLWNKTANTQIGSEVCSTNTTGDTLVSTPIAPSTLPTNAQIEVRLRATSGTATLYKAGLMINLVGIYNMVGIQRAVPAVNPLAVNTNFNPNRIRSWETSYGSATVNNYIKCGVGTATAGSGSLVLKDYGVDNSTASVGVSTTTPVSTITASTINLSGQTNYTSVEAGPLATTAGNHMFVNYAHTSGSFTIQHCLYETQATY